jgi:manganese/zinc/iron transport system permease protein
MLGGLSAFLGTVVSALFPRVAAGATIVLAGSVLFVVSLCFGRRRGIVLRGWEQWQMQREIGRLDLLRSAYELIEQSVGRPVAVANELWRRTFHLRDLVPMRAWSAGRVRRIAARLEREGLIAACGGDGWTFTGGGAAESWRIVRNHRLWEMYLMQYADVAASHVDRSADRIEHVLDPQTLAELERQLAEQSPRMPRSSHDVGCDVSSERDV